jgi:acetylornithine deacetylase/succinyl-diaminopimelate desuccinylase-like protein
MENLQRSLPVDWEALTGEAAQLLSRYIRFNTTNPPGNEAPAIHFLAEVLREFGLKPKILVSGDNRANLVVRLPASQATAAPCLLYSHADVVPAKASAWSLPPFGGQIKDGFVWGRGALDDKGLGIIFVQALGLLHRYAPPKHRDILLVIAADEELCGEAGAAWLLENHPDSLAAEFVWDEGGLGLLSPAGPVLFSIAVAEKSALTVQLKAHGLSSHAAVPNNANAQHRLVRSLYRIQQWKQPVQINGIVESILATLASSMPFPQKLLYRYPHWFYPVLSRWLRHDSFLGPLVSNTITLTRLKGGHANNVVPAQAEARLDVRLLPDQSPDTFLRELQLVIDDPAVTVLPVTVASPQATSPVNTPFYRALAHTLHRREPASLITPYLTPGATDSRFFRAAGMKAYGFMPMLLNSRELGRIHSIDERVSIENLRWGMQVVFETLIELDGMVD